MDETANYDEMTTQQRESAVDECLRDWGIEYGARQVPGKQDEETKNWQIAWKVGFRKMTQPNQGAAMETDFWQGVAHHPKYNRLNNIKDWHDRRLETLRLAMDVEKGTGGKKPAAAAVLSCLIMDARAGSQTFKSWADEFGYDTDSRKAEAIYRACQETSDQMAKVFNMQQIEKLAAILEQY